MSDKVILGDCYEVLKTIDDNSIDLILTDPPYNISRPSNFKKNSDNKKFNNISIEFGDWDEVEIDLDSLFSEFKRVLKKGGTLIIFYDVWKSANIKKSAERWGFKQPRVGQWVKTNPVPINSKKNYLSNAIEFFFVFVKGNKKVFNSQYDRGIYNYPICHGKERTKHPTQKPLELMAKLIQKHSSENDTVLDPFGGSGTTGVASKLNNRRYILIEYSKEYYDISIERIEQLGTNFI
jgi:site-specific DNA-methyltransferase (adenine-specific)